MSVDIGSRRVTFEQIAGRQFVNGREYRAVLHDDPVTPRVTISDTVEVNRQLELAAEQAVMLAVEDMQRTALEFERFLDEHGFDYVVADSGPMKGIPRIVNANLKHVGKIRLEPAGPARGHTED